MTLTSKQNSWYLHVYAHRASCDETMLANFWASLHNVTTLPHWLIGHSVVLIVFISEQFTMKVQEPLFLTWLSFPTLLSVCVQVATTGGRHLASVTRCKTAKAFVNPFITFVYKAQNQRPFWKCALKLRT